LETSRFLCLCHWNSWKLLKTSKTGRFYCLKKIKKSTGKNWWNRPVLKIRPDRTDSKYDECITCAVPLLCITIRWMLRWLNWDDVPGYSVRRPFANMLWNLQHTMNDIQRRRLFLTSHVIVNLIPNFLSSVVACISIQITINDVILKNFFLFIRFARSEWQKNRFTRGSYSFLSIRSTPQDQRCMREPYAPDGVSEENGIIPSIYIFIFSIFLDSKSDFCWRSNSSKIFLDNTWCLRKRFRCSSMFDWDQQKINELLL